MRWAASISRTSRSPLNQSHSVSVLYFAPIRFDSTEFTGIDRYSYDDEKYTVAVDNSVIVNIKMLMMNQNKVLIKYFVF